MAFLRLEAIVRLDRNAALQAAADAIGAAGGWIVDHAMFSDVMAVVNFAVPAERSADLVRELAAAGITVDAPQPEAAGAAGGESRGQLVLRFAQGKGDLRRDVPAFH